MILQNRFLSRNVFSLLLDGTGIRRKVFYQISSVVVIIQPDAITRSIPKKRMVVRFYQKITVKCYQIFLLIITPYEKRMISEI